MDIPAAQSKYDALTPNTRPESGHIEKGQQEADFEALRQRPRTTELDFALAIWHSGHMRHLAIPLCLAILALPLHAGEPLSPEAFEAYSTGKTLYYGTGGQPYGVEEYLENRRVRWSFLDGQCKAGRWYEDLDLICFVYEDNPMPQCWSFYLEGGALVAHFENEPSDVPYYEVGEADEPMLCLGPEIGV